MSFHIINAQNLRVKLRISKPRNNGFIGLIHLIGKKLKLVSVSSIDLHAKNPEENYIIKVNHVYYIKQGKLCTKLTAFWTPLYMFIFTQ